MDNKFGKYQCTLPFSHFHVTSRGTVTPCCNFSFRNNPDFKDAIREMYYNPKSSKSSLPKVQNGIENVMFHNKLWNDLRSKSLKNEREPGCSSCYYNEESGSESRRTWANRTFPESHGINQIKSAELKLGAKCNLGCRTCSYTSTNKLLKENSFEQFGKINIDWIKETQARSDWIHDEKFWNEFKSLSKNINHIQFTGGEPLLINEQYDYLAWLAENKINPIVQYITNATIGPTDEKKKLWNNFDKVIFDFSIDAVGSLGEYMRTGSVWEEQVQNIKDFVKFAEERKDLGKTTSLCMSTTVSVMNVTELSSVFDLLYDLGLQKFDGTMNINLVRYPEFFDISNIEGVAKQEAIESILKIQQSDRFQKHHTETLNPVLNRLNDTSDKKFDIISHIEEKEKFYKMANPSKSINYQSIMPDWWDKLAHNS